MEFAEAIHTYCPQAWIINYTNPMSVCVKTLYHVFPEIKAFGCCHEVFGTQRLLASVVQSELGIQGVEKDDIKVNVLELIILPGLIMRAIKELIYFRFIATLCRRTMEKALKKYIIIG
ncbi:MAG: hypothetical protein Q4G60_03785 [bacterium]|nr:hypothetical protein [bacterium]